MFGKINNNIKKLTAPLFTLNPLHNTSDNKTIVNTLAQSSVNTRDIITIKEDLLLTQIGPLTNKGNFESIKHLNSFDEVRKAKAT